VKEVTDLGGGNSFRLLDGKGFKKNRRGKKAGLSKKGTGWEKKENPKRRHKNALNEMRGGMPLEDTTATRCQ